MEKQVKQYEIRLVNLDPKKGHTHAGVRPCIVVQANILNKYSPLTVVIPLTTTIKEPFPSEFLVKATKENGLTTQSRVLASQIITVDKDYLIKKLGTLESYYHIFCKDALKLVLGL